MTTSRTSPPTAATTALADAASGSAGLTELTGRGAAGPGHVLTTAYDGYAREYEELIRGRRAEHLEKTIALVRALLASTRGNAALPGRRLVDLACGPGLVSEALAAAGWRVIGVDASLDQVHRARERIEHVLHADATATRLPAGADAVVSTYSHTDVESWSALVAEACRLLCPGGAFVYVGAHPAFVGPHALRRADPKWPVHVAAGYYHDASLRHRAPGWRPGALRGRVGARHLTLQALLAPVLTAGLQIEHIVEAAGDPPTLIAFRAVRP